MNNKARLIAFYLPQFHPIPENDKWWGKGFTEWTNVGKAKPLFRGHYQPHVPADFGYYDLRIEDVRIKQAELAMKSGIEGFCYWHYWFGNGKKLLERPFQEVLKSNKPDFPFCLGWANESWKGFSHGLKNREILIEQLYLGNEDYRKHFYDVLPAFKDSRYMQVDGKPIFLIYKPLDNPEIVNFIKYWRELAIENGLKGIFFVGQHTEIEISIDQIFKVGVDGINTVRLLDKIKKDNTIFVKIYHKLKKTLIGIPRVYKYKYVSKYFICPKIDSKNNIFPTIIPGWDHSPRSGKEALVLHDATPDLFEKHLLNAVDVLKNKDPEHKILFVKSWNEWAEGNYLEPDLKWGRKFTDVLKRIIVN